MVGWKSHGSNFRGNLRIEMNKKLIYLVPEKGINYEQNAGAGTHIRGTVSGFRGNNIDVLPIVAGDVFSNAVPESTNSSDSSTSSKRSLRSIVKKFIPQKIKYLFRDFRRIYIDHKFEKKIIEQVRQFDPDFIYERSALFSTCGIRLSRKLNIPVIIESDGCMPEITKMDYGLFSVRFANKVEKYKLRRSNYVAAYNEYSKKFLAKKFDLPLDKIYVKTLGMEFKDVLVRDEEVEKLKSEFNLIGKKVVGFVGAISKYHGVEILVDSAKELHDKGVSDIAFVIVGWSSEAERLKDKALKLGLDNVVFTGRVDKTEVPKFYRLFDVGVIPNSDQTIYPVKILEYGTYCVCPLVPDYEVFDEILEDNVTGFYFKKSDPNSLANKLVEIFDNQDYKRVASEWQKVVSDQFSWKNSVSNVVALINSEKK